MLCCLYDVCITRLMTLTKSQGNCLKVADVVLDGEQGIVFYFLPGQITVLNCLIETGVVGDRGRIEPQCFILLSEWGRSNLAFFSRLIFVFPMLKIIVFLGIQL